MISRRRFLAASTIVLNAPLAARAQQAGRVYRIGFLRAGPLPKAWGEAFQQGLREHGYVEGRNLVIEFRFTEGAFDQLPQLAEELVRMKVEVIVASSGPPGVAAKRVTTSVPIVVVHAGNPVEIGLVASLGRPGGNVTGSAVLPAEFAGKRLQLLRELVPKLRRVAVIWDRANPMNPLQLKGAEAAAHTLGMQLQPVSVQGPNDFDAALKAVRGADGLLLLESPLFMTHRARVVRLAADSRLPASYGVREMVDAGGLMSYGPDLPDLYRRAATYVDKILKGARPADLPVEQPTKFEFAINIGTAKALGLTIPPSLLLRADQILK